MNKLLTDDEREEFTAEEQMWMRHWEDMTPPLARKIIALMAECFEVTKLDAVWRFARVLKLTELEEALKLAGYLVPDWDSLVVQGGQDNRKYKAPLLRQKAKPKIKGEACVKCGQPATFVTTPNQFAPKGVFYCVEHESFGKRSDWEDQRENFALRNELPKRKKASR